VERLLAGPALPVDARAADSLGKPRREHGIPSDVDALLADLADTPHDDVLDVGRVDARALDERAERPGRQVDGVDGAAAPARPATAERGAAGVDERGSPHGSPSSIMSVKIHPAAARDERAATCGPAATSRRRLGSTTAPNPSRVRAPRSDR